VFLGPVLPALAYTWRNHPPFPLPLEYLAIISPGYSYVMTWPSSMGLSIDFFWLSVASQFAVAFLLLGVCSVALPHLWQTRASKEPGWKRLFKAMTSSNTPYGRKRRFRLLNRNPILWLMTRNPFGALNSWILFALIGGVAAFIGWRKQLGFEWAIGASLVVGLVLNFIMLVRLGTVASNHLCQDRQSGAIDLLLATPLSEKTIVRGIWSALRWEFLTPLIALLIFESAAMYMASELLLAPSDAIFVQAVWGMMLIMFHLGFVAMPWTAMWWAVRIKNPKSAMGMAALHVLFLPLVIYLLLVLGFEHLGFKTWWEKQNGFTFLGIFSAIWISNCLYALWSGRRKFFSSFRMITVDRETYMKERSLLRWIPIMLARARKTQFSQ
jgi:hypothetical protein